jgi:phospholipid/cholesterol/gamma-HCH transport system ATP-binding protein
MIELRHVSKYYGANCVLEDVSLDIPTGSRYCIIGSSGVGKSVLTRLILGLESLDEGDIFIDGKHINTLSKKAWRDLLNDFGVVFQSAALFDSLTVLENVGIRLFEERQYTKDEIEARVIEALSKVNLKPDILHQYPAQLSGGMRKRVGISRAILHDPHYLIYDEPTTGLDPVSSEVIDSLIAELADAPERTSIVVTHDMQTVRNIGTHVAMVYNKGILFNGTPAELEASAHPHILDFLRRLRTKDDTNQSGP